jgi:cytochrome c6
MEAKEMRNFGTFAILIFAFAIFFVACQIIEPAAGTSAQAKAGEDLFKQHCAPCHPNGGNIVNPQKTLRQKDRESNGVKTASDIVSKTRNPGPGMTKFDEKALPDKDAQAIAEYILKTFK